MLHFHGSANCCMLALALQEKDNDHFSSPSRLHKQQRGSVQAQTLLVSLEFLPAVNDDRLNHWVPKWILKRHSPRDIPCSGIWPSPAWFPQPPVLRPLTWQPRSRLFRQLPEVRPLSRAEWGFAWEETANVTCVWIRKGALLNRHAYLDTTLAAADRWALTANECVSSATAERMKPSSSVNTVTELDFLLTPSTCKGHTRTRTHTRSPSGRAGARSSETSSRLREAHPPGCAWWTPSLQSCTSPGVWSSSRDTDPPGTPPCTFQTRHSVPRHFSCSHCLQTAWKRASAGFYLHNLSAFELYLEKAGQSSFQVSDGCRFGPVRIKCFGLRQTRKETGSQQTRMTLQLSGCWFFWTQHMLMTSEAIRGTCRNQRRIKNKHRILRY